MGRAARPLHDPGDHRPIERGSFLQAACRGSLNRLAKTHWRARNTTPLLHHARGHDHGSSGEPVISLAFPAPKDVRTSIEPIRLTLFVAPDAAEPIAPADGFKIG